MFSNVNYDKKLATNLDVPYVDVLATYSPTVDMTVLCGDVYGMVLANGFLYAAIANEFPGIVRKIDPVSGTVLADIIVGNDPRGLCFDGQFIWCANYDLAGPGNTVSKIDPTTDTVIATVTVGSLPGLIEADDDGFVWVACFGSTNVYKINIATDVATSINVGVNTCAVCYDNRGYMYFGSKTSTVIKRVRTTTNAVTTITMPSIVYGLTSASGCVWATDFGTKVYKINRITLGIATITVSPSPTRRPGFDGKRIWVPCGTSGKTVIIDTETSDIVATNNNAAGSNKCVAFDGQNAFISVDGGIVRVPLL